MKNALLLALFATLAGCASSTNDTDAARADTLATDAVAEAALDAQGDAVSEPVSDVVIVPDAASDAAAPEASVDAAPEAAVDAAREAATDAAREANTSDACTRPAIDTSAIDTLCGAAGCPTGYTCHNNEGIVLTRSCIILCNSDCDCPNATTCTMQSDKGGSWHECQ